MERVISRWLIENISYCSRSLSCSERALRAWRCAFGLAVALFLIAQQANATTVTFHVEAARATLSALENPSLSHEEALKVAQMYGNQAVVRKLNEFKIPATPQSFADALYAAAHDQKVTEKSERALLFDRIKPKAAQLKLLVDEIVSNPAVFEESIEQRIQSFTPPNANIHLDGYVLAAGDGGGYTFGGTDFFLNLGLADELLFAQLITTHELYHAVQGAYANARKSPGDVVPACADITRLFNNLYEEGTANYVEDIPRISESHAEMAKLAKDDFANGLDDVNGSVRLLELSVSALEAPKPVPYDNVYAYGFFGHGILYSIAYVMARDIAEQDGPSAITALLQQPSYQFILRYTQLTRYGADKNHPRLEPNTIAAAQRLAGGCK